MNYRGILLICLCFIFVPVSAQEAAPPIAFQMSTADAVSAVTLAQANLRASSSTSGAIVTALPKDSRLEVLERGIKGSEVTLNGYTSDQWLHVRTEDRAEGYIWAGLIGYELTDAALPGITIFAQPGVADEDINLIAAGTWTGLQYIENHLTGAVTTTIKMFHQERSNTGEVSCCMAFNAAEPGIRIMTLHPTWIARDDLGRISTGAHEISHIWQGQVGHCLAPDRPLLGFWLSEGHATWLANQALVAAGWTTEANTWSDAITMFHATVIRAPRFQLWESPGSYDDFNGEGHYGYNWTYLAAVKLVQDYGAGILQALCDEAARIDGGFQDFPRVFETAVGIPPREFYDMLPAYFAELGFEERVVADVGAGGCIAPISVNLSRILIRCHGVNPDAGPAQAGFIVQPGNRFGEISEIRLPEGTQGRWEERTEVYFVRFVNGYEPRQIYTVVFVYNGVEYPFQFAFP